MSKSWNALSHRELQESLAQAKELSMIEVSLGSAYHKRGKLPRADVVQVTPSYNKFRISIFEIKRTKSDLQKSLKQKKYESYFPHCHLFYFACQKGIVEVSDLPEGVGLYLHGPNGWYSVKRPKLRNIEIPRQTLLSYLFYRQKGLNRLSSRSRLAKDYTSYYNRDKALRKLGKKVAELYEFEKNMEDLFQDYEHLTDGNKYVFYRKISPLIKQLSQVRRFRQLGAEEEEILHVVEETIKEIMEFDEES